MPEEHTGRVIEEPPNPPFGSISMPNYPFTVAMEVRYRGKRYSINE
jgi:hypothetical protein